MSGISGIGPIYTGIGAGQSLSPAGAGGGQALDAGKMSGAVGGSSILSLSSTSLSATSETLLTGSSPMLSSNEAIGAALLMLILQYLQTSNPNEKKNLTDMIVALASMQQPNQGGGEMLFYSSSSLSIESTQLTIATGQGLGAYTGATVSLQQAPPADAGAAGLDITA